MVCYCCSVKCDCECVSVCVHMCTQVCIHPLLPVWAPLRETGAEISLEKQEAPESCEKAVCGKVKNCIF